MAESAQDGPGVAREHFLTTDPEVAHEFLKGTYADQRLRLCGALETFRYEHRTVATDGFAINRNRATITLSFDVAPLDDILCVNTVRSGAVTFDRSGYDDGCATADRLVMTPPAGGFRAIMDEVELDDVILTRSAVADYAEAICGLEAERFAVTGLTPVSAAAADHWRAAVSHVRDNVLGNPAAVGSRIVVESASRLLAATFLATFPNTAATPPEVADPFSGRLPSARLREVVDYLQTHAADAVGPAEVAGVAGVPAHEVDEALRRRRNTSAAQELWRARLRGARRDLVEATPAAGAVAAVAARWGFVGAGTFHVAYTRATGGETPEETLRR